MNISTGFSVEAEPSYQQLLERALQEAQVIVAGKEQLEFLLQDNCLQNARLAVVDGQYFFKVDIPVDEQQELFKPGRRRGVGARGGIQRGDIAQQAANDAAIEAIEHSAALVNRVASAMATSRNLRMELSAIERKEKVDTDPARRHIYWKQDAFFVEVDAQRVVFDNYAVRTAVAIPGELVVSTKLASPRSESTVHAAKVEETTAESEKSAAALGKRIQLRFAGLNWWQKTVLEGAKHLGIPINVTVTETKSTCTDKSLPMDVNSVRNFDELLKMTFVRLHEVLQAANDADFDATDAEKVPRQNNA
jgi:hypothetical protein